ncbi:MAG: energy transducer TonB [Rhodocyclales bacterium]|nr:energy transducer TonB [Rhodocyclales bacterium]
MTAAALPSLLIDLPFPAPGRARVAWAITASVVVHGLALGWLPVLPPADSELWEPLQVLLPVRKRESVAIPAAAPAPQRGPPPVITHTAPRRGEVTPERLVRNELPPPDTATAPPDTAAQPAPDVQPAPASQPLAPDADALASFGRALAGAVSAHQRYPRIAQLRQWQGTAVLQIELAPDGQLKAVRVLSSSGHEILDRQALEMVRAAAPLPPPPAGLAGRALAVDIPVVFRLAS